MLISLQGDSADNSVHPIETALKFYRNSHFQLGASHHNTRRGHCGVTLKNETGIKHALNLPVGVISHHNTSIWKDGCKLAPDVVDPDQLHTSSRLIADHQ